MNGNQSTVMHEKYCRYAKEKLKVSKERNKSKNRLVDTWEAWLQTNNQHCPAVYPVVDCPTIAA